METLLKHPPVTCFIFTGVQIVGDDVVCWSVCCGAYAEWGDVGLYHLHTCVWLSGFECMCCVCDMAACSAELVILVYFRSWRISLYCGVWWSVCVYRGVT